MEYNPKMDLSNLNPAQKEAVLDTSGPMMILAGAGSGKTRTIVNRIQYLIHEQKVPSSNILAMTFSNKAAKEMRERVEREAGYPVGLNFITTFHSFCARVLRQEASYIGLSRNFSIYDDSESKSVIKAILGRRGISLKETNPAEIKYFINDLKNIGYFRGCEESKYFEDEYDIDKTDLFFDIYEEYERELHVSNAVDFGGMIVGVIELFSKHPKILERYQKRYKYLLVDEYQDTNRAQFYLVRMLSDLTKNICVVGDEDQSIYSWRGADIHNILDFEKFYPDFKLVKLEQNYRSSKNIIEAASHVINNNTERKGKKLWTDNTTGDEIEVIECLDDRTEADFVAGKIQEIEEIASLNDISIFYRTNSQSRMLEDSLRKRKIPYKIVGGIKFYDRKEIKDILSYLKLLCNNKDSLSFSRVINSPARGFGAVTLRKLENEAIKEQLSLYELVFKINDNQEQYSHLKLSQKVKNGISEFVNLMEESKILENKREKPSLICQKIIEESGYLANLKGTKSYENQARIDNLKELISAISQYEAVNKSLKAQASVENFLESITLNQNIEEEMNTEMVSLMTIHSSKGLEFEYVFIVGVEENIFPSIMSLDEGEHKLEEERRLFYVAMTRAMKKLYITCAKGRMLWGKVQFQEPSRFIYEIPEDYLLWHQLKKGRRNTQKSRTGSYIDYSDEFSQDFGDFDADEKTYYNAASDEEAVSTFSEGQAVNHGLYGEGVIVRTEGAGLDEKVTIKFKQGATKKFLTKYAPIEILL